MSNELSRQLGIDHFHIKHFRHNEGIAIESAIRQKNDK